MVNGRHLILLGILACAGLISVHDGQCQVDLCYQLGTMEKQLRDVRSQIQVCKIEHQALQSPKAVAERAIELNLAVKPAGSDVESAANTAQKPQLAPQCRSLGHVQAPPIPNPNTTHPH